MRISTSLFGFTTALLVAVLAVAALHAYGGRAGLTLNAAHHEAASDDAKQSSALVRPATIEACQQVQLHGRVAGIVKSVTAEVGERVKRGQLLVSLDAPDVELELRQKMALLQQAKAEINQARSSVRIAQASFEGAKAVVMEAEAGVKGARVSLEYRKKQVERVQSLQAARVLDQAALEEAREKLEAAQAVQAASEAKHFAAKAAIEKSTAKIVRAEASVQVAEAHLAVAEAGLQRTRALLDSTMILAPFDGVITRRAADVGAFSRAAGQGNAPSLVTVARTDLLRIVFQAPETLVPGISVGMPATVRVDAFPNRQFEGKVSRLSPALDPQTRTLRAEIDLPNPAGQLLPGMTCEVLFKLEK